MPAITTTFAISFLVLLGALSSGCGSDCESLCQEAQDRDCTTISGDCSRVCASFDEVASKGSCGSQLDDYVDCSASEDVCTTDARCSSEENALGNCAGAYCLANPTDPDCAVVVNAL